MKKLLGCIAGALLVLFVGCASIPTGGAPVGERHKVDITLTNMDKQAVTAVMNSQIDWDRPGIMKPSQLLMMDEEAGRAWFKMFSGLSVSDAMRLKQDLIYLDQKTKVRDVTLIINSPGGDAFQGLAIAGLVGKAQEHGFTIRADAMGIVASAAVPIFAQCRPRSAVDGTIFMVHEAALWKWPGRETSSDIRAQNELMQLLGERYIKFLVDNSNLSREKWEVMEARTSWFTTEDAKKFGMIDE